MARPRVNAGGGFAAVGYVLRKGLEVGSIGELYARMRSRNACKTCAVGMGGQRGGMVNEAGHFPEVCKKSVQAQAGDMAPAISDAYFAETPISAMGTLRPIDFEKLGRLTFPILAEQGATHFRRIGWDDALARTAAAFRVAEPDRTFFYSSGRASNEAAFLMQLVARAYGTNNINNCSYYCHQASGVALSMVYGSGTASITLDDLDRADLAIIAGANPASNHPRLITKLVELRERGGKVIVINPLRELGLERFRVPSRVRSMLFGSKISDLYLQPHIGADVAVFKALLKGVIERGAVDREFVDAHGQGWDVVEEDIRTSGWDELVLASGLSRASIEAAADMIAEAGRGVFMWAMGLTHHTNGVDNILALSNLALSRGWLGRRGTGLLPIRGHSNVQGVGSCGVAPQLKEAFASRIEQLYGFTLPDSKGLDTFASMEAAERGEIDVAFLLGGNLYASNPDSAWASRAMRGIDTVVYATTKLNEGHVHGRGSNTLILPVLARDEESQSTTQESMFNLVRLSDGGAPAVSGEMRSEVEVIASIAELVLPTGRFDWASLRSHTQLREQIAACVPGYSRIAEIDRGAGSRGEFQIDGRTFHQQSFSTDTGRAAFHVTPLPKPKPAPASDAGEESFRLMTIRSEGQFNTVVYEQEDLYRGNRSRDVVMMSEADARKLAVGEGDRVIVESETGSLLSSVAIVDIRAGNLAMYYPEANALVPRRIDERSKTPAFKCVDVSIRPVQ